MARLGGPLCLTAPTSAPSRNTWPLTDLWLAFCDVFEFRGGKTAKLTSYLMPLEG